MHTDTLSDFALCVVVLCAAVLCAALQAQYAAALAKYKKSVHTDTLSDAELAAAQAQFNDAMKLFNRGSLDQALVIFDEVGGGRRILLWVHFHWQGRRRSWQPNRRLAN